MVDGPIWILKAIQINATFSLGGESKINVNNLNQMLPLERLKINGWFVVYTQKKQPVVKWDKWFALRLNSPIFAGAIFKTKYSSTSAQCAYRLLEWFCWCCINAKLQANFQPNIEMCMVSLFDSTPNRNLIKIKIVRTPAENGVRSDNNDTFCVCHSTFDLSEIPQYNRTLKCQTMKYGSRESIFCWPKSLCVQRWFFCLPFFGAQHVVFVAFWAPSFFITGLLCC